LRERQAVEAAQLEELANRVTGPVADELRGLAQHKQQSLSDRPLIAATPGEPQ
jgi:hypothetical protein